MQMQLRTVTLPINPGASWALAWPAKDPAAVLPHAVDCGAWQKDAGLSLINADVQASADLTVGLPAISPAVGASVVTLQIGGGTPGGNSLVRVALKFTGGNILPVEIGLPIGASSSGLVAVSPITGAITNLVEIGSLPTLTVMVASGMVFSALPTSKLGLPPNTPWSNGGVVTLSDGSTILPSSPAGLPAGQLWSNAGDVCIAGNSSALPTSKAGLTANQLWNNGGVLCVV